MPRHELLNLFPTKEDRTGRNIQAMSDFFPVLVEHTKELQEKSSAWESVLNASEVVGKIKEAVEKAVPSVGASASAISLVQAASKMGEYVVDTSNLPSRVLDGLKTGVYRFGESHKIPGNKAPTIYGNGETIQITLKRAIDPSLALSNVAALSMQIAIYEISSSLRDIKKDIDYLKKNVRDVHFINQFFDAREAILRAAAAKKTEEHDRLLCNADEYLMKAFNWLLGDIEHQISELAEHDSIFNMLIKDSKPVDELLSLISDDMRWMHRFTALRTYLLNYRGEEGQAAIVLTGYSAFLRSLLGGMLEEKKYGGRTAFELIHTEYHYDELPADFWINWPQQIVSAIDSYSTLLELKGKEVIRIGVEQ